MATVGTAAAPKYSKEKQRAIEKLKECWPNRDSLMVPEISDSAGVFLTDFYGFTTNRIELKGTNEWRWNQSVANVTFLLQEDLHVVMHKLNSRRKSAESGDIPSLKVWLYQIFTDDPSSGNPVLYFLWCEKGVPPDAIHNPADIRIEDLAFLKSFTSQDIAAGFGW